MLKIYYIAYSSLKISVSESPQILLVIYTKVWFFMEIAFVTIT